MRRALSFGLCSFVLTACADDVEPVAADGSGTAGTTGLATTTTEPPIPDGTGTTDAATSEASTTDPEPEPAAEFARHIRLTRMTANQATQVELVRDGQEVDAADYNTRLISGRTTLLRAYWTLHASFQPRDIIGRLTAEYPDGTELTQDFPLFVDGDSGDGGASFQWLLQPDQVIDGMQYRVRLLEANPAAAPGEVSDPPPILPYAGPGTLGVYDVPLEMEVVVIPVEHQFEGEVCTPEISDESVVRMVEQLEQNNPLQRAIVTVAEPMVYTDPIGTSGTGFSPVLSALAQRRALDDPPPHVYYYGYQAPCDGFPGGLLGQAIGIPPIPPTPEMAMQRISTGRWLGNDDPGLATAVETMVHEVGHSQGRYHILCSGGEAGADPAYPHPNGRIGVWGFGIYDRQLRSPTGGRDYMTYCSNEFVSDFSWELTLDVIEILTSWSRAGAPAVDGGGLLMGALYPDGTEDWWTAPGGLPTELATPGAAIIVEGIVDGAGPRQDLPAWVYARPDAEDTVQVIAPRPEGLSSAAIIDLMLPDRAAPQRVDAASIRDLVTAD